MCALVVFGSAVRAMDSECSRIAALSLADTSVSKSGERRAVKIVIDGVTVTLGIEQLNQLRSQKIAKKQQEAGSECVSVAMDDCPRVTQRTIKFLTDLLFAQLLDNGDAFLRKQSVPDLTELLCLFEFLECDEWVDCITGLIERKITQPEFLRAYMGEALPLSVSSRQRVTNSLVNNPLQPKGLYRKRLTNTNDRINCAAVMADGKRIVVGSDSPTVHIFDVTDQKCISTLCGHVSAVECILLASDGDTVITGSHDRSVRVWHLSTGECFKVLNGHSSYIVALAMTGDGNFLVTTANSGVVRVWDTHTWTQARTLAQGVDTTWSVALTPDGKYLITGGNDRQVRIWELATGDCVRTLTGHAGYIFCLSVSPDGKYIASGSGDGTIRLWDIVAGMLVRTFVGHTGPVYCTTFSPDGQRLVSGSTDRSVNMWDTETGALIRKLTTHADVVTAVTTSATGNCALSVSADGELHVASLAQVKIAQITVEQLLLAIKVAQQVPPSEQLGDEQFRKAYRESPLAMRCALAVHNPKAVQVLSDNTDCRLM